MMDANNQVDFPFLAPLRRYVPMAVWIIVVLTLLLIPLKIISYGYIPPDDALRHAAKAVSGKPWQDILILNDVYKIDHEYGWNLLLEKMHTLFNMDAESLVIFSVVVMFLLAGLAALPWLRYPEVWLASLVLSLCVFVLPYRLMLGRPYILTVAMLIALLFFWRRFGDAKPRLWMMATMTGFITISVYFHGTWYLWALPVAAFFCARQFRWCFTLCGCWIAGVIIGSALTGHLLGYPVQAIKLALLCVGAHETERTMASELQPRNGDVNALIILAGLLLLRRVNKLNSLSFARDPVFWLVCITWVLGFRVGRFWDDWGRPALIVLVAWDLQSLLASRLAPESIRRLALTAGLALLAFISITSDASSRWTGNLTQQYLSVAEHPELKGWMPEKDGIFYSTDMRMFYQTFYKNPTGDWRYMLGFEPTWMPKEDFKVYHSVIWNYGDFKALEPWIKKMRPADRLALSGGRGNPPNIPELEWYYGVSGIWLGRLPGDRIDGGAPAMVRAVKTNTSTTNSPSATSPGSAK